MHRKKLLSLLQVYSPIDTDEKLMKQKLEEFVKSTSDCFDNNNRSGHITASAWIVDFKTTSVDLAYMASRMKKMSQLMGYQFVSQANFEDINGCMVYYHQLKASKSRKTGLYGETKTDFMKFPMIFNNHDYNDWRKYVIWNAFNLKKAKDSGYPPNFNSCYEFNSQCPYLALCEYPKWDEEKFKQMEGFVIVPDEREAAQ